MYRERSHLRWCLLSLGLTLIFGACTAGRGPPDGGRSSDGGPLDGGSADAGVSTLSLTVSANPNSVLSAVARVGWTGAVTSFHVTVTSDSLVRSTPPQAVSGLAGSTVVPVLPLQAETTYVLIAAGTGVTGEHVTSNSVSFKTGTLPSFVPVFAAADGGTPSPGDTLIARLPGGGFGVGDYLTITDGTGAPVWYYASKPSLAGDFQQQPDGTFTIAGLDPTRVINGLDDSLVIYHQVDVLGATVATWTARDVPDATPPVVVAGTDGHDLRLQPNGDALLFGFVEQTMDLTSLGGAADASVVANVLERVTATGAVTFSWNAFDHLSVANVDPAATAVTGTVVDFTHANSIDVTVDGDYLIGLRNLSQVLKIDSSTGEILWKLGGVDSDFTFVGDPLQRFFCQHGARALPNGDILLFDDGDGHSPPQSRAAEYRLDTSAMTATLVWSAEDDPPLYAYILGYAQRLANGNTLITYGTALHIQEVDPSGNILWDLLDPTGGAGFYRAYRLPSLSPLALVSE